MVNAMQEVSRNSPVWRKIKTKKQRVAEHNLRVGRKKPKRKRTGPMKDKLFKGHSRVPCRFCGKPLMRSEATFDHVRPKSKGGYCKVKNGAIACRSCNSAKGAKAMGTFIQELREQGKYQHKAKAKP